jgi:hypothetical protein
MWRPNRDAGLHAQLRLRVPETTRSQCRGFRIPFPTAVRARACRSTHIASVEVFRLVRKYKHWLDNFSLRNTNCGPAQRKARYLYFGVQKCLASVRAGGPQCGHVLQTRTQTNHALSVPLRPLGLRRPPQQPLHLQFVAKSSVPC